MTEANIITDNHKIVILIPNYNGQEHLADCLRSLSQQAYRDFLIMMIDDASTDDSVNFVQKNFPLVKILRLEKNLGFAKAINTGINYVRGKYRPKYFAILNNDTRADPAWLKNLVVAIEAEKNIVAVATNILYYDRPNIINSQGGKFTFIGYGLDINMNKEQSQLKNQPNYVLASCWGATLIKDWAFDKIGLLDENYYSYFEDLDWGYRANLLDYKIIFAPKAIVYHKGSASWSNYPFQKAYLCRRNSLYTMLKNYELKNIVKALPLVIFDHFILYPAGQLFNRRRNGGIRFLIIPWLAWWWNLMNLPQTLRRRKRIQTTRKISDQEIFKLSRQI